MERIYNSKGSFSFMTWNLYLGTDLTPILNSTNAHYPLHVTEVFLQFLITNFHRRVKEIANEIAANQPDVIGLQEAENFRLSSISNRPFISYDYVDMLISELRKKGIYYDIAVQNDNFSMQLPLGNGNINFLDRDVLLIRKASGLKVIRRKVANFTTNLTIKVNGKSFRVLRGWSSVDVKAKEHTFRVINTHLDANSQKIRSAQGNELLNGPANTTLPLIVLGDLNSNAEDTDTETYKSFINAGFKDIWTKVGKGPGYTCCQEPDLLNPTSTLNNRIDFILFKNGWQPLNVDLVGNKLKSRTSSGLWPSDHAGVVGNLTLKK